MKIEPLKDNQQQRVRIYMSQKDMFELGCWIWISSIVFFVFFLPFMYFVFAFFFFPLFMRGF